MLQADRERVSIPAHPHLQLVDPRGERFAGIARVDRTGQLTAKKGIDESVLKC